MVDFHKEITVSDTNSPRHIGASAQSEPFDSASPYACVRACNNGNSGLSTVHVTEDGESPVPTDEETKEIQEASCTVMIEVLRCLNFPSLDSFWKCCLRARCSEAGYITRC
jgi:hypothetical protein